MKKAPDQTQQLRSTINGPEVTITKRALTSTVFVAEIRKTPDISQANGKGHARENEFKLAAPLFSWSIIFQ
jgi:hypothetical protein